MLVLRTPTAAFLVALGGLTLASLPAFGQVYQAGLSPGGYSLAAGAFFKPQADPRDEEPPMYRYPGARDVGMEEEIDGPDGPEADTQEGDEAGWAGDGGEDASDLDQDQDQDAFDEGDAHDAGRQPSFGVAVDACEARLQDRDEAVSAITSARRMAQRYSVEGQLEDGRGFACSVDEDGAVRSLAINGEGMA